MKSISKTKVPPVPRIIGYLTEPDIANCFKDECQKLFSSSDPHANENLRSEFFSIFPDYFNSRCNDDIRQYLFSWTDMLGIVNSVWTVLPERITKPRNKN